MVKTLAEPKKTIISSLRSKLLAKGFDEEVEYDSINIEPVLIYSFSKDRRIFLKHKWETVALVRLTSKEPVADDVSEKSIQFDVEENVQDGTTWARFLLPGDEDAALKLITSVIANS